MKEKLLVITVRFIVLLIFLSGCQLQIFPSVTPTEISPKLAAKNPHIRGAIVAITQNNGKVVSISVVGKNEGDTTFDAAFVGITNQTVIYIKENSKYKIVTPGSLMVNQKVAILFTGPVGDSYPVQARADEILILQ